MGSDTRVLVTGAGGQVGTALRSLRPQWTYATRADLDVTDAAALGSAVSESGVVVHLAAFTNVDACESDPEKAKRVNALATEQLARRAAEVGARVVYLSTDYVFDGSKTSEYSEDDAPNPLNVYGETKLEGEKAVGDFEDNLVVRTSWVFGDGRNFIRSILRAAAVQPELKVVADQRGRPTAASDLAHALVAAVEIELTGILHIAGDGTPASWAEVARLALESAGRSVDVVEIDSESWERAADRRTAPRPKNGVLALDLARSLSVPLFDWRTSAIAFAKEIA